MCKFYENSTGRTFHLTTVPCPFGRYEGVALFSLYKLEWENIQELDDLSHPGHDI
jgi:hypothetical protein